MQIQSQKKAQLKEVADILSCVRKQCSSNHKIGFSNIINISHFYGLSSAL